MIVVQLRAASKVNQKAQVQLYSKTRNEYHVNIRPEGFELKS